MNSHRLSATALAFTFSVFIIAFGATPEASAQTVEPTSLEVRVGRSAPVTINSSAPLAPADISWSGQGDFVEIGAPQITGNTATVTLKALKFSPTPVNLKATVAGTETTIRVTTLTSVLATDFPGELGDSVEVVLDAPRRIRLNNLTGLILPGDGIEITSDDVSVVSGARRDTTIVITGHKAGTGRLTVKSNGQAIKTVDVTVKEPVATINVQPAIINVRERGTFDLNQLTIDVVGKAQSDLKSQFPPTFTSSNPEMVRVSGTTLTADRAPRPNEERPKLIITAADKSTSVPIQIEPLATTLNVITQKSSVATGGRETFVVDVRNSQGLAIPDAQIRWTLSDADKEFLRIVSQGGTQVIVEGLKAAPTGVTLTATLTSPLTDPPLSEPLVIKVRDLTPTGFAPLRIRIDLLDSQTAKDLFGKKAADEFFISKIRLFNNLKNSNGEFGDSILVYSESLEIRVQLERKDRTGLNGWKSVDETEYRRLFGEPEVLDIKGQPACKDRPQPNFVARYRPYTFDIVANTHDRRDERSVRSRILQVAEGVSIFSSFVTAIAVPRAGSDLPLGLDKFKNLLIPSFEKLYPSLKEVQRQNIISMVIRPLEEIPFGSDVTRILFIPKGKMIGMIPQDIYRIGGVSTTGACAEVGIIKKAGSVVP